jgi:hypothetical protein
MPTRVTEKIGGLQSTRKLNDSNTYEREWFVQFDQAATTLTQVESAVGVGLGDGYPGDPTAVALSISVQGSDDIGLTWTVRISYGPQPVDSGGNEPPGNGEGNEPILKQPIWSAGSSVTSGPVTTEFINDNTTTQTICNSAGDPLEGLEAEQAEFRLTLTTYFLSHTGWMSTAVDYTNAVNSDTWHGKAAGTWKCQGCSAQLQSASWGVYWEVTWEFAYRDTWNLLPWDIGFAERCGEDGVASSTGTKRKAILGQDKKPVKGPVALANGVALPAGTKPSVIANGFGARVYKKMPFSIFGQIYTPTQANTQ